MDALIASAGPIHRPKAGPSRPRPARKAPTHTHKTVDRGANKEAIDPSTYSVLNTTRLPSSFHQSNLATGSSDAPIRPDASTNRIKDKKLRAKVGRNDIESKRSRVEREEVNEWLGGSTASGGIEVDEEAGEKSWRVRQEDIQGAVGVAAGAKKFDLAFENMGEYMVDYSRNGRHLAVASTRGHVATFDWQAGKLHSEIQLKETIRDIKFLQSESFYAVAQKRYVFIYDQDGVELHKLKQHIDPTHLEYLPYHYLLASLGNAGWLKYHDVSTGTMLTQIPTHLGSPTSMCQNPHSAIIHAGHTNGTMTLWSPNMTTPHVKLLAHRGPVVAMAVDGSENSVGRYTATAGLDGMVKLWDGRMWGKELRSWRNRNTPSSIDFSQKGMLAVGGKSGVTVYRDIHHSTSKTPEPYLTLPLPSLTASDATFCPYDDLLAVGHGKGISSLLVPGSGEPNFDSAEADVYESHSRRRERDVRSVMEKIRPELITLDTDFLGRVGEGHKGTYEEREAKSYRQLSRVDRLKADGKAEDEDEGAAAAGGEGEDEGEGDEVPVKKEKEKYKARGKSGSMKKYLRKKKKNVIDPSLLAMRHKVAQQRKETEQKRKIDAGEVVQESGALARFG